MCNTSSNMYSTCHAGNNCGTSLHPSFCSANNFGGSSSAQTLPFGMTSGNSSNKSQLLTSLSQNCSSKGLGVNMSQAHTSGIDTSNTIIDMNHKNLLSDKAVTSASIFSLQQAPSHSSPTTVDMEEISLHCHTNRLQQVAVETGQLTHTTQFERCQQQRFETISPPTVPSTPDPAADSIFNVSDHRIPSTCSLAAVNTGKLLEAKTQFASQAGPSNEVLVSLQTGSDLDGRARSCFDGHFSKNAPRQSSMFGLDDHQLNQPQNTHHHQPHLHHNAQDSTTQLIVGTSSILQTSVKHMVS